MVININGVCQRRLIGVANDNGWREAAIGENGEIASMLSEVSAGWRRQSINKCIPVISMLKERRASMAGQ
jgi:hypothetical protein